MRLQGQRVVVTGAAGFIGSHLVERLVEAEKAKVCAFIRYKSDRAIGCLTYLPAETLKQIEIIRGDLTQLESLQGLIREGDTVFHLGALGSVPYSFQNPLAFEAVNVQGTANLLHVCRQTQIRRLLVMSTAEVYGSAQYLPIDEAHPLCPRSPYAATKIAAEKLAESFWYAYGLPVTIARPFNVFGPRQSERAVIPTIVGQALHGSTIRLGNIEPERDFTYVSDTVRALIALACEPASCGKIVNIGSRRGVSVQELVQLISELLAKKLSIVADRQRVRESTSEVRHHAAATYLLHSLIEWEPHFSLADGLREVIHWMDQHTPHVREYAI